MVAPVPMKVAWLFPGQGAQAVGMGKDVFEASEAARSVYEAADAGLGQSLAQLCFEGPMDELTLTKNTQPAIVTTSAAMLAAMRERLGDLVEPACAAGHSLGEYSALCAAGVMAPASAAKVCRVRGEAMQSAVAAGEGAMAAIVGLEGQAVVELCEGVDGVVSPANFNAPTQTVIAGHAAAVEQASTAAKEAGAKVIPLKVSAPFHCALMSSARGPLSDALEQVMFSSPSFEVLANVDAEPRPDGDGIRQALIDQVDQPVQWVKTIHRMQALGVTHALEIGPGRVLAGLVKRIAGKELKVLSVNGLEAIDKVSSFLEAD